MLRIADLADAADPVLLIWGDAPALDLFATLLRDAALTGAEATLADPVRTVRISLQVTEAGGGLTRSPDAGFRWLVRRADCDRFADMIDAVSASDAACHDYLDDAEGRGLTIKVSKGEYADEFDT
jgi:hypothetical protein